MQENWKIEILGNLVKKITDGSHYSPKEDYEGQYLIGTVKDFNEYGFDLKSCKKISEKDFNLLIKNGCRPQIGDVLMSKDGTIGIIHHYRNDVNIVLLSSIAIIRPDSTKIDSSFLSYYLKSPETQWNIKTNFKSGSALPRVVLKDLKNLEVFFPANLDIQNKIGSILSSLDDKIELNLKMNQTLESIAQTIFKRWFVDFQFPGSTGELGNELPKGWVKGKLAEGFNITMGQSPPGESYNEEGEGIIFFQGRTDFGFRFPSTRLFTTDPKRYAEKFETLVSVRAPVGDINMAIEKCCLGRGLGSIIHKNGSTSFTYYFIKSIQDKIKQFDLDGTVFGSITKKNFENIEVIYPTEDVINEFENLIKPFDNKIYLNTLQILTLTTIRDSLLPKLITGKISVN